MPLHLLALSGRRVFRTMRRDETSGWTPWQDLNVAVGPLAAPARIACATVNGALHICVLETNALWHTLETAVDTFPGWGAAHSVAFPGLTMGTSVDCAAIGSQLHVCLDGFRISGDIMTFPAVHRSIRSGAAAWSPPREIMQRSPIIRDIACTSRTAAGGSRQQLEVFARSQAQTGVGADRTTIEALVHTTVLPGGAAGRDLNMVSTIPPAPATANVPGVRSIAAAGIGSQLHVMLAQEGELFHTVSGGVANTYESVRTLVADFGFGTNPLTLPACANVGGNLHVCSVSGSRIVHTIRLASGAWRNPESNSAGFWNDVTAALGPLPASVVDIACAGDPV